MTSITEFISYKASLERDIHDLPCSAAPSALEERCNNIQNRLLSSQQLFSHPVHVAEVRDLAVLFLTKTGNNAQFSQSLSPLFRFHFTQFPKEVTEEFFLRLPLSELLNMRTICHYYKDMIDNSPLLQRRIAHEYFQKMHPKCNIPLHDLNYCLMNNRLAVQINSNLTLWKINQSFSRALPWVSHLIVKDGSSPELKELFTHLEQNPRLISLSLINCEVDSECTIELQNLLNSSKSPITYLSKLTPVGCELPLDLTTPSESLLLIDPAKAETYSLEKFLSDESDVIAIKEFEKAVSNNKASSQEVLEALDAMKPVIQSKIVTSLWYSRIMNTSNVFDSPAMIQRKTRDFIRENPHHPALIAATCKHLAG